jgi:hypothetical protein
MAAGVGAELNSTTDVGIVMFGESLQLRYANEQARNYMERAGMQSCRTNKTFVSKLSSWGRKSGSEAPWDHGPILME